MKKLLVIRNQNNHYLGKHGTWVDGSHAPALFRTEHKDMAVNELIETNIRDFDLRGEIIVCDADKHGYPLVEVLNPIPMPDPEPEPELKSELQSALDPEPATQPG